MTIVEIVAGPVSSGMVSGTTAMLSPASTFWLASLTSSCRVSAGCALSICSELISNRVPPPTWNEAMLMPKNSMMRKPATALTAMTTKLANDAMWIVRRRCSRVKVCVNEIKNGIAPIGLTMASNAINGFRSMRSLWPFDSRTLALTKPIARPHVAPLECAKGLRPADCIVAGPSHS